MKKFGTVDDMIRDEERGVEGDVRNWRLRDYMRC